MDLYSWQRSTNKNGTGILLTYAAVVAALLLILGARQAFERPSQQRDPRAVGPHRSGAVFVPYTQEYSFFRQTVQSLLATGWRNRIIVLDNSPGHDTAADEWLLAAGVEVLRTSGSLNFSQLQNVAGSIALERGLEFYFCAHPGVLLLGPTPDLSFQAAATQCVQDMHRSAPNWGLIFFGSDRFVAFRAKAAADVRWDVFIPSFRADCDFYQSLKVSGWSLQQCAAGRVVVAWQELDVPYSNHTAAAAALDAHARAATDAAQAEQVARARRSRAAALPVEAEVAWAIQLRTSVDYYQYKWRTDDCDMAADHLPWQADL